MRRLGVEDIKGKKPLGDQSETKAPAVEREGEEDWGRR
jgi:hypothetical protein